MIADELLALLRCPETKQTLTLAPTELLARIETERVAGRLQDRAGRLVQECVEAGLVRADGMLLFPIRDGIPVLLLDDALPLGAK